MSANANAAQKVVKSTQWYPELDSARFAAAIGIVWLHTMGISPNTTKLADVGRYSVPAFSLIAMIVMANSLHKKSQRWANYTFGRLSRLGLPFLFWTAVYIILRDAKHFVRSGSDGVPIGPYLLLGGASLQLWFVPFLLITSVALFPIQKWLYADGGSHTRLSLAVRVFLCCLGLFVCFVSNPLTINVGPTIAGQLTYVGALSWETLPAVFWGIAIGPAISNLKDFLGGNFVAAMVSCLTFAGCLTVITMFGRSQFLENISSIFLLGLVIGIGPSSRLVTFMSRLGVCSFGIYLIHSAVALGFDMVLVKSRSATNFEVMGFIFIASAVLSTVLTWMLMRARATRWLVA